MDGKKKILKEIFGYGSFRPGQEGLIDAILSGRDIVGVMPTGAGKSVCFQVPALLLEGITLVVSPLISLMKDQVDALVQSGVRAAYLNSSLTPGQYRKALENAAAGVYRIIYVAPERLTTPEFLQFARQTSIAQLTVDEAHCASQWGQDFRPSYLEIPRFLEQLSTRPVVSAFTATATVQVREDIVRILELRDPEVVVTGFDRQNLTFEVLHPNNKPAALQKLLERWEGRSGIVYCATRKTVEEVCQLLQDQGISASRYHAGLPDDERRQNQEDFLYDRARVMVATNAFGMGIDKSNVGFVVHYQMPKDLESYYQEAGRAGRDGEPAHCVLLYGGQDVVTNKFLIDKGGESQELDQETREQLRLRDRERLRQMTFYCHTTECLRATLLRYFGEQAQNYCGNCSSCLQNYEERDVTVEAQKVLSCVKRTGERYGVKMIVDILRGSRGDRLLRLGLDSQSTYGLLKDMGETQVREIVRYLIWHGFLVSTDDEYPVLHLSQAAGEVLFGNRTIVMKLVKEKEPAPPKAAPAPKAGARGPLEGEDAELFQRLRALRARLAAAQGLPAFVVLTDAALADMAIRRPQNKAGMLEVSGIGQTKLNRYGKAFLAELEAFRLEKGR